MDNGQVRTAIASQEVEGQGAYPSQPIIVCPAGRCTNSSIIQEEWNLFWFKSFRHQMRFLVNNLHKAKVDFSELSQCE